MPKTIAVLPGDGIGEEVMAEALRVLSVVEKRANEKFELRHGYVGGAAWDKYGAHFPPETKKICDASDAILFGSVGGPVAKQTEAKWRNCEANSILLIRKTYGFNANLRPAKVYPELADICPLRQEIVEEGVDLLIVRELLGDCYFGEHHTFENEGQRVATDLSEYTEEQIRNIAHTGFQAARKRRGKLTSVDKANVLDTSKLWRSIVKEVGEEYPDVGLEDMLVDNCAMQLIMNPTQFDVIVTSNMFGDILSDAAAVLPGSLGLVPSASLNSKGFGLFEPSGGSAQDIAGKGIANTTAQILSLSMLLRFSFSLNEVADSIENAVTRVFKAGYRTQDIAAKDSKVVGSKEFTDKIIEHLEE